MAPILNRSPLAAICFEDANGAHIRVYYQDVDGNIRETFYDDGQGWNTRQKDVVGKGKLNTGIAATSWNQGTEIRVYFLSPTNQVVERYYSGGAAGSWKDGSLTTKKKFIAAPYSQVATVSSGVGSGPSLKELRVYYQDTDNRVREVVLSIQNETWLDGTHSLPVAVPATSISAIMVDAYPRVYLQLPSMQPAEWVTDSSGNWTRGKFTSQGTYAPGSYLSAAASGDTAIHVVGINDTNKMTVTSWKNQSWQKTVELSTLITYSAIAAVKVVTVDGWLRAYCQSAGNRISEQGSDDEGHSWVTKQDSIPTGA
ncbi:hypothetical protein F4805DRAFT_454774 [Annulohypoxylon moriforme]|nr:hypothetical protein F4805DRAFT_454774 [Annulohypoxylon moriforme]